jgi:hypothetical protein
MLAIGLGLGVGVASGEEYSDPAGFSFTHPKDWIVVTSQGIDSLSLNEALMPETRAWIEKNSVDLSKVSVLLVRNGKDDFLENLNVVVEKQELVPNDRTLKALVEKMRQQYVDMGVKVEGLVGRVEKMGANEALVTEYQIHFPFIADTLKQKQAFIPGGGKTYIVTCTCKADDFTAFTPTFDKILASMKVPARTIRGGVWNQSLKMGLVGGVVGGVTVGLLSLFRSRAGSKPRS